MPHFPDEARAEEGRPIPPAWEALQDWVDELEPIDGGIHSRTSEWPEQTDHFVRPQPSKWKHPFRISLSGTEARVRPGAVNLEVPRMGADNLTLDGRDEKEEDTGEVPVLDLLEGDYGGAPEKGSRSFLCVRVLVDPESGLPLMEENPLEWLTIVHRKELPIGYFAGGMPSVIEDGDTVGLWPLAFLYWNQAKTSVSRWFPNVFHNLQYRFDPAKLDEDGEKQGPDRHWFFGIT